MCHSLQDPVHCMAEKRWSHNAVRGCKEITRHRTARTTLTTCPLIAIGLVGNNLVGWLELNVPFQHKYDYIRDD